MTAKFKKTPPGKVIENAPQEGPKGLREGERVVIQRGDAAPTDEVAGRTVTGSAGRVVGQPYVSVAGPNKGDIIQVVKDETTGENLGVPISRLSVRGATERRAFGWSRSYEQGYERVFGKKRASTRSES